MGFSDSSALLKIALILLPLALILHIVGIATPNWSSYSASSGAVSTSLSYGLWKLCVEVNGVSECANYPNVQDWVKACQAFGIIGVLAVAGAAILEVLCTIVLSKATHKVAFIAAAITAFVGAASIILSAIIWSAKVTEFGNTELDLSWSFGLSITGGVLAGIGGILVALDLCQNTDQ
ncbi:uncharacterized protein LOC110459277 [Mizuhopecten yessoensis]|uniref:Claudin n=1 Tax=Mizuhopecten yessoensis TaxID=6573 RepID=A0A210R7F0_MIZYE|nr:uncharacterized protein LOC110459277 [Mizuhopecten yessoensis]OWF56761.1 hypothetical protein KP79_PYT00024 [Mizuhopecten yessoensis]